MKINDVIQKCIKIPGISIKQAEYSMELILNTKEGKGSMTFFSLFPGLSLAYIFINSPTWTAPDLRSDSSITKGPLLLNYCVTGRCEMILNSKNFVYIKDRELSLTECFAQKEYVYPRRIYEGLEFFIDIDTFTLENTWVQNEFSIDFRKISEMFCPHGSTYISTATHETIITSDLRQHHPAWELAEYFSISETSLKNYFRGVYGQNISVYLREMRMNKAGELLASTRLSVAEIAAQVGYLNQSKFASVFKKHFGVSPLEYRRTRHLDS